MSSSERSEPALEVQGANSDTRRQVLKKAGLVAGGAGGLMHLTGSGASAYHNAAPVALDFEGFLRVTDFGVEPGPTGDAELNAQGIQDCIDEAASAAGGRASVYFPPGDYRIVGSLNLPTGTRVVGHGPLSVIQHVATETGPLFRNKDGAAGNDDIELLNLALQGYRASSPGTPTLVKIDKGARIYVRNVEGRNAVAQAFLFTNVTNGAIEGCHIRNPDGPAQTDAGIQIGVGCADISIRGNRISNCGSDSIAVLGGSPAPERIAIIGNICNASQATQGCGIFVKSAKDVAIVGNTCHKGPHAGLELQSADGPVEDVLVEDNTITSPGTTSSVAGPSKGSGVLLRLPNTANAGDIRRVIVRGNLMSDVRHHGVMLFAMKDGRTMADVDVSGNLIRGRGVAADTASRGAGVACIDPTSVVSDVRVADNEIRDMPGVGVHVERRFSDPKPYPVRWNIVSNLILDSGKSADSAATAAGILIDKARDVLLSGNRAHDTSFGTKHQTYGIYMIGPDDPAGPVGNYELFGNSLAENATGPVYIVLSNTMQRLRARDNPGFNPWTGEIPVPTTGWTIPGGGNPAWIELQVTFRVKYGTNPFLNVPFPSTYPPQVICTVKAATDQTFDAYVVAKSVTHAGFIARVVAPAPPALDGNKVSWTAEPFD